jgi:hypothetical protein
LIIANIAADANSFSHTSNALEFVADISKLKKFQNSSESFAKAVEAAKNRDEKESAKSKPWKSPNKTPKRPIYVPLPE